MLTALFSFFLTAMAAPGGGQAHSPALQFCQVNTERRGDGVPTAFTAECPVAQDGYEALQAAADHALASVNLDLNRRERYAVAEAMAFERGADGRWHAVEGQMLLRPMFLVPPQEFMRRPRHYRCVYQVYPGSDGRGEDLEMTCFAGASTRPSRPAQRAVEDYVRLTRWVPTASRYCFTHAEVGEVDGVDSRGRVEAGEPLNDNLPWPDYCPED